MLQPELLIQGTDDAEGPNKRDARQGSKPEVLPNDVMIVAVFALIASALVLLAANEMRYRAIRT